MSTSNLKKETLVTLIDTILDALNETGFVIYTTTEKLPEEVRDQILAEVDFDALIKAVDGRKDEFSDKVGWLAELLSDEEHEDYIERYVDMPDMGLDTNDPIVRLAVEMVDSSASILKMSVILGKLRTELRARGIYCEASLNQRDLI